MEVLSGYIDGTAVRQVPAMGKVHAQNGIARFQQREIHRHIGLRAGMRLYIGMLRVKQRFGTFARQILHDVHALASAVIPLARIPFRVLVGQVRSHGLQDGFRHKILRCDELNMRLLALQFRVHGLRHGRIRTAYGVPLHH